MQDLTLEKAVEVILAHALRITETEELPLLDALGRVLAEDVTAAFDNPPFDRSPLDGYTFAAAATQGATEEAPARLTIIGEECAGAFYGKAVPAGSAIRIMTGGAIPPGCDCVVRQECVQVEGDQLMVPTEMHAHENYCFAGEDVPKGTVIAKKGDQLTAAHLGVIASMGYAKVKVYRPLSIALASTGDELLAPGEQLRPGKIYNSNLYILAGRLREMGFQPQLLGILPDNVEAAAEVVGSYRDKVDLFLTTGGVSVGKKDIMHGVVKKVGERLFWRVCMKPGGPAIAYTMGRTLGIALSGNPFASYATFELLARPAMAQMAGRTDLAMPRRKVTLADNFPKASRGRRFIRARVTADGQAHIPAQHASGSLASVVGCNAFLDIPAGTGPLPLGARAEAVMLF